MPAKFYVASTLSNSDQAKVAINRLTDFGHEVSYDWTAHGFAPIESRKGVAEKELQGVIDADLLFVVWPGGGGTHIEMGVAISLQKSIIFVAPPKLEREVSFYQLDNVFRISEIDKAIEIAHKYLSKLEEQSPSYE